VWCNRAVPWCTTCDHYLAPPAVRPDGTCPRCEQAVEVADRARRESEREELAPLPWHFKLLLAAFAIYLGFRFAQLFGIGS
jgi:hypothetical protein